MCVLYLYTEKHATYNYTIYLQNSTIISYIQHNSTPEMNIKMQTLCTLL